jgi:hypothetical protein
VNRADGVSTWLRRWSVIRSRKVYCPGSKAASGKSFSMVICREEASGIWEKSSVKSNSWSTLWNYAETPKLAQKCTTARYYFSVTAELIL